MDSGANYTTDSTTTSTDMPAGYEQAVWEYLGGPDAMAIYENNWYGEDD